MIRVLHVVTYMGRGGLETFLMNYYRFIDRERVQFDFLVHRSDRAAYDDEIETLGGIIYRIQKLNPFSISYRRQLQNFFEEHREYQIIHVHQDCLSSIILKTAKNCGVKVRIAHSHSSSQNKDFKYPIKLFYRQYIPRYATKLVACSKAAGDWMFRGEPYDLLHNAIDSKQYRYSVIIREDVRRELGIENDKIVVGHVGSFSPPKNHMFLINIFKEVRKREKATLLLVGDGNLRPQIEKHIKALSLDSDIILTGIRNDVCRLLQAMDVFVFPSVYEGLPISLVEAQAAGIPCLMSDRVPNEAKITELVEQIPLDKCEEIWAQKAIEIANREHEDTYYQMVEKDYDIESNAVILMKYYEKLLETV